MEVRKDILLLEKILECSHEQVHQNRHIISLLRRILNVADREPTTLTFTQVGDPMNPLAPGQAGIKFQIQLGPAGFTPPSSVTYSASSDNQLVSLTPDPADSTGATFDVTIDPSFTAPGTCNFTATASGTNADGSTLDLSTGPLLQNIVAAAPPASNNATTIAFPQIA
jgi:hypothetical protein